MKNLNFKRAMLSIMLLLLLFGTQVIAQTRVTGLFVQDVGNGQRSAQGINVTNLVLQAAQLRNLFGAKPNTMLLTLPLEGGSVVFNLTKVNVLADKFYILTQTQNGVDTLPYTKGAYYMGTVQGAEGESLASVSVFENEIMATFSDVRGNFVLGAQQNTLPNGKKQADATNYVLYNTKVIDAHNTFSCVMDNDAPDAVQALQNNNHNFSIKRTAHDTVRIYLEGNYNLYHNFVNTNAAANYVTSIFNAVATIYDHEQITLQLAPIFLWSIPDNYSTDNASRTVNSFRNYRTSFDGEQAQLLDIGRGNGGIAGGFNTFCTDKRYSYASVDSSFDTLPTYSWMVEVIAHEFGHCFGSRHTHWCGWIGGAIDGCPNKTENGPDDNICFVPNIPNDGGTIMSYCYYTSVGINFANGFGQQPGDKIRDCVANRYCHVGSIKGSVSAKSINLEQADAAFWKIDNSDWKRSDEIISGLAEGQYTVSFKNFSNVGTPIAQSIQVLRQQMTLVSAVYIAPSGTLQVNLTGANGQGKWSIDNGDTWLNSGDTLILKSNHYYSVTYKNVVNWFAPDFIFFQMGINQQKVINADYVFAEYCFVKVNVSAANWLEQWSLDNNKTWHNSGDTVKIRANYPTNITFKDIRSWVKPNSIDFSVVPNELKEMTLIYQADTLSVVQANIIGGNGKGQWTVDDGQTWHNHKDTLHLYINYLYTIKYKPIPAWQTPYEESFKPTKNSITTLYSRYYFSSGSWLNINLTGASGNGQWSLNGINWYNSGAVVVANNNTKVPIFFKNIPNWVSPNTQFIYTLLYNKVNEYTLGYTLPDAANNFSASLTPNPVSGFLHCITQSDDPSVSLFLHIYNAQGGLMYSNNFAANNNFKINMSDYANGMYFIRIFDAETNSFVTKKVIVKH
jgi:hypothetical protein